MAFCAESSASSAPSGPARFGTALPSANLMLMSVWNCTTNSRNDVPSVLVTVACAREPASSTQVDPSGSMMSDPIAPLLLCLTGSDEIRLVAPYSIGVAIRCPPLITTSPAYHLYLTTPPGPTVWLGLNPTFFPSLFATL